MDERLLRPQFAKLPDAEKQIIMQQLAEKYEMEFKQLAVFNRWGQTNTTGIFSKNGAEFVFVPGDTVTLGWEKFVEGLNKESAEDLQADMEEFGQEDAEAFLRSFMTPVRQAQIVPMLVERQLNEIGWEPVGFDDPRLLAHPEWLKDFQDFLTKTNVQAVRPTSSVIMEMMKGKSLEEVIAEINCTPAEPPKVACEQPVMDSTLTIVGQVRFELRNGQHFVYLYHDTDYSKLKEDLQKQGFALPNADEWAYLCGGGCRTLYPWGDSFDYNMKLYHFASEKRIRNKKPYDMEKPNFFGLSIAYDPYKNEVVEAAKASFRGGDGGGFICGGAGLMLGFLGCSPHFNTDCLYEDDDINDGETLNGDYDFYRRIIRLS
jgi:formylglycine-generating enzyme required for sulfatase activity